MTTHKIKLREEYADAVFSGDKSFEIRYNDRGYQKGDRIRLTDWAVLAFEEKVISR